ncbi:MAG: aldo/keto reductase [Bacteroidales bacterium]|nr:aldo/keto reductase [Bacteroidales bacterium]
MKYRNFGPDQIKISEVGLGCWQLGGNWGSVSDEEAKKIIRSSVDNGITFFDTADVYGGGRSEKILGNYFKENPTPVFIATKVGRSGNLYPNNYTEQGVRNCIDDSLNRLQTDSLDLVQLHCIPTKVMQKGEIFNWLRALKAEGKIKNFGASVESMSEALLCLKQKDLYSLQIIFNIFRQKPAEQVLKIAQEKKVGIIARVPLASGLLSGKFSKSSQFSATDHRNYNRDGKAFNVGETFAGLPFNKGVELAEELKNTVPENMTLIQMALRWILDFDAVSVVIPGATTPVQSVENAKISGLNSLPSELHKQLFDFYNLHVKQHIRGPY